MLHHEIRIPIRCEYSAGILAWYVTKNGLYSAVTIKGFINLLNHPLISQYLKGIYNEHPVYQNVVNMGLVTLVEVL